MNVRMVKFFAGSLLVVLGLLLNGCHGGKGNSAKNTSGLRDSASVHVVVSKVTSRTFEEWNSYSADLRGVEDATLNAPYQGGRVNSIKPVGSIVHAGDALADIDGERYDAALQAAQAQVDVAKSDLERAKVNVEKGSLGNSVIGAANLAYQNARMGLATARRAYQDSRCESPFNGVLVSRSIERYQTVAPGVPTMHIARLDRFEAVLSIPETEAFGLAEGMKTEFRLLQQPDHVYSGVLKSFDRAVDTRSRTIAARIEIANNDRTLRPGMVGSARILRRTLSKAIVVPATALLHLQNETAAMIIENGVAVQHTVTVGATRGDSVLITSGIDAGDLLVVTGAFQVSNGTRVAY